MSIIKFTTYTTLRLLTENLNEVGKPEAIPIYPSTSTVDIFILDPIVKFHTPAANITWNLVHLLDYTG